MPRTSLFRLNMEEFERRYLVAELKRHGWNRTQTARELGLSYRALRYKILRLGIPSPDKESFEPISA